MARNSLAHFQLFPIDFNKFENIFFCFLIIYGLFAVVLRGHVQQLVQEGSDLIRGYLQYLWYLKISYPGSDNQCPSLGRTIVSISSGVSENAKMGKRHFLPFGQSKISLPPHNLMTSRFCGNQSSH